METTLPHTENVIPRVPVMEAIIDILEDEGVTTVFGIPGAGILPFYSALQHSKKIKHYLMRHEEGGTHAADGFARASGQVGVVVGTSGPAGTNMVTGLYAAKVDSIPIVAITGQNVRAQLGKEAFQAVEIAEIVQPVTKKSYCVKETGQLPWVFREAFRIAREGRPGPVLIDLPLDVQRAEIAYDPALDGPLEVMKPKPNLAAIRQAVDMILEAERPVFLMGGGVISSGACEELVRLAEYLSVPVVTTLMGKGGIRPDHPLYVGQVGVFVSTRLGNQVFLDADLVLGVGCRFSDRHTGELGVYTKGRKFIHVDIEPTQIGRIIPFELGIVSDAKLALQAMLEVAREKTPSREPNARVREIPELRRKLMRKVDFDAVPIKPQRVFKEVNEFFDEEAIFVTTIGLNQMLSSQLQDIYKPRHYLVPGGAGPLGWDLPASIGAKIARPDKVIIDIVGDYGFGFCCEELAVACMYDLPIIVVILNDGHLGLIRQTEKYVYNMHFEVDTWYMDHMIGYPRLIDFVKFAEAFGAAGERVERPQDIRGALENGVKADVPYIIDVIIHRETDVSTGTALNSVVERE